MMDSLGHEVTVMWSSRGYKGWSVFLTPAYRRFNKKSNKLSVSEFQIQQVNPFILISYSNV
jgi:hypothetical protein